MIVVTGAAGFIGSQLASKLASGGRISMILVDHPLRPEKFANLGTLNEYPLLAHQDFLDQFERQKIEPSQVFHLGACSDTTVADWDYLEENNLNYTKRIWRCCARTGARLIYASSAATYGDGSEGFDDEGDIVRLRPLNLYGRSKQEFDLWALEQVRIGAAMPPQWVGLKFFNVFGPGEAHKGRMASMVYHGCNQMTSTGKIHLFQSHRSDFPDGGQMRDFIYVRDIVEVMQKIAGAPALNGIFNLGTGKARSFNDLARALANALQLEPRIEYTAMPGDLQGKYQYFTQATMRKLGAAGIHHNFLALEDSIRDYVRTLLGAHP